MKRPPAVAVHALFVSKRRPGVLPGITSCFVLMIGMLLPISLQAQGPPNPPTTYSDSFEQGYLFFDDGVGVLHVRQSGSTAETDYAPGISASDGGFYARLLVQPWLQNDGASPCPIDVNSNPHCGINSDQTPGICQPGAATAINSVNCDGPFTEWGLPFGGFDGNFDTGIPIKGGSETSIDIYLDTAFAAAARASLGGKDYRFDWDSDLLDNQGMFLQDYIFNVAIGQSTDSCAPGGLLGASGFYVIEATNNSQRSGANAHNLARPQVCISNSGWYTFRHIFHPDHNNNLEVDYVILDNGKHVVASWKTQPLCPGPADNSCTSGQPIPFSAVGANFLGWFPDQEINDLAVDNVQRKPNDEDEGEGDDGEHDHMQFQDSASDPQSSQMQYQDPSQNMNVQSVNGARSITYNGSCVSFITDAVVNSNPGYVANFAACDLSVLGLGIGTFSMNITGPLGFVYQKSAVLTSGFVSIQPH